MSKGKHLTLDDRKSIQMGLQEGRNFQEIARELVKIRQQFPKKSESTELHDEQLHLIHAVNLRIVTMTEIFVLRVVGITMDIAVDARLRNAMKFVRISRNRFAVM